MTKVVTLSIFAQNGNKHGKHTGARNLSVMPSLNHTKQRFWLTYFETVSKDDANIL